MDIHFMLYDPASRPRAGEESRRECRIKPDTGRLKPMERPHQKSRTVKLTRKPPVEAADTQMRLNIAPLAANTSLRTLAYDAIKKAITEMDMYGQDGDIRLDERQLST